MKLKKRYIVIFLLIIIIAIIGVVLKSKNSKTSSIFNKEYGAGTKVTFDLSHQYKCSSSDYKSLSGLIVNEQVTSGGTTHYFQVILASETNWDGGGQYVFMYNGCPWGADAWIIKYNELKNDNAGICQSLKEEASKDNYMQLVYNDTLCVKDKNVEYEGATQHYPSYGYDEQYASYGSESGILKKYGYCDAYYNNYWQDTDNMYFNEKIGTSYFQILKSENYINRTGNSYTDVFLINGCAASMEQFITEYNNLKGNYNICNNISSLVDERNEEWFMDHFDASSCVTVAGYQNKNMLCTNEMRQKIIENNNQAKIQKFNVECTGLEKIKTSTITMDWQGGWGPQNLDWTQWGGSAGVYTAKGVVGKDITIEWDADLKDNSYTYGLVGWSTNANCSEYPIGHSYTIIGQRNTTQTFTFQDTNTTYYACYNGNFYENDLFDGTTPKSETTTETMEQTTCNASTTYENSYGEVPMKLLNRYIKKDYNLINPESYLGKENDYCNVLCTDIVDVYYPNIFETVPAGQYFELMYEPEIKATRTCQSEFRYEDWKNDYQTAINTELEELDDLSKAQAEYEAAKSLVVTDSWECGCCGAEDCDNCGITSYGELKAFYYLSNSKSPQEASVSLTASSCEDETFSDEKSELLSVDSTDDYESYTEKLIVAEQDYEAAVRERLRLEQFNLQCYTILDSDKSNNEEIKYNDVLQLSSNYIIDETYTYKIKTPKVSVDESRYGTNNDYMNSIVEDTTYYDSTTKITDTQIKLLNASNEFLPNSKFKSTRDFYLLIPNITFKYDDATSGDDTSRNINDNTSNIVEETLLIEGHVKLDTGSYTDVNTYTKNSEVQTFKPSRFGNGEDNSSGKFYLEKENDAYTCVPDEDCTTPTNLSSAEKYISFDAYKAKQTFRTVEYYFTYHEATEYCSEIQSGIVSVAVGGICDGINTSLSKLTEYKKGSDSIFLKNNVYPVSLNAINGKYTLKFTLDDNLTPNISDKISTYDNFTGAYTCSYEVTNDALTLSEKESTDYKDLKSNTIFRSVTPYDIDPNNRGIYGNLGENWSNAKGQAVQESMIQIETNDGTATNDTYNPANLEYSFTLTPAIIKAIKSTSVPAGYNANTNYNDFNLTCAKDAGRDLGRECTSKFLTELSQGKVDGEEVQSNYLNINPWGLSELNDIREIWKYYNGTTNKIEEKTATVHMNGNVASPAMGLEEYLSKYEKWGVLP